MQDMPYLKKAEYIAKELRAGISAGRHRPGERLPTRAEMRQTYKVSSDTVQRALNWLLDEGFVTSDGRHGTFVHSSPPHLSKYALLFPYRFLPSTPTSRFYYALYQEACRMDGDQQIKTYDGFSGRAGFLDYETLLDDVRENRLAGLIFASAPFPLNDTPLLADDGVPRTAIMSSAMYPHIASVYFDVKRLARCAAERFRSGGRRHVATLVSAGLSKEQTRAIQDIMLEYGLLPRDTSMVGVSLTGAEWTRTIVKLLFSGPAGERPDALWITDDNLILPATQGLAELGLSAPDDVLIIGHTNYPWPAESHLPLLRLGFSIPELLAACIRNIDLARQGREFPALTLLPPLFEEDYVARKKGACVS